MNAHECVLLWQYVVCNTYHIGIYIYIYTYTCHRHIVSCFVVVFAPPFQLFQVSLAWTVRPWLAKSFESLPPLVIVQRIVLKCTKQKHTPLGHTLITLD